MKGYENEAGLARVVSTWDNLSMASRLLRNCPGKDLSALDPRRHCVRAHGLLCHSVSLCDKLGLSVPSVYHTTLSKLSAGWPADILSGCLFKKPFSFIDDEFCEGNIMSSFNEDAEVQRMSEWMSCDDQTPSLCPRLKPAVLSSVRGAHPALHQKLSHTGAFPRVRVRDGI